LDQNGQFGHFGVFRPPIPPDSTRLLEKQAILVKMTPFGPESTVQTMPNRSNMTILGVKKGHFGRLWDIQAYAAYSKGHLREYPGRVSWIWSNMTILGQKGSKTVFWQISRRFPRQTTQNTKMTKKGHFGVNMVYLGKYGISEYMGIFIWAGPGLLDQTAISGQIWLNMAKYG